MESLLKTVFILQIHQNPNQVNKFIKQLIIEDQAEVYVHIDKKSREMLQDKIVESPHVNILKESISCEWGDISQVDATLLLIKEVIASNTHYDFVCLRSGQDLLVRKGFRQFLCSNRDKIFMQYRKMGKGDLGLVKIRWPKITRKRYTTAHPLRILRRILISLYSKRLNMIPNRSVWNQGYTFYKGSQWFVFPYEVAKYIIDFLENNPWYYNYFKNTLVPDESFFQTLLLNSPYRTNIVNDNQYFFKWGETLSERNSPQNLKYEDITLIEESSKFFARKFDGMVDQSVIDYFSENIKLESYAESGLQEV